MAYNENLQNNNEELETILEKINTLPEKEFIPTGTKEIDSNGEYDVFDYEYAKVNVPQGTFTEGSIEITKNGEYDVDSYKKANVNLPKKFGAFTVQVDQDLSGFCWLVDASIDWGVIQKRYSLPIYHTELIGISENGFEKGIFLNGNHYGGIWYKTKLGWNTKDFGATATSSQGPWEWTTSNVYNIGDYSGLLGIKFPNNTKITYINPTYKDVIQNIINDLFPFSED